MVSNMTTCDECNGWLNPALAVDAAVQRGDEILLIKVNFLRWKATGHYLVDL